MIGQGSLTASFRSHSLCHPDDNAAQAPTTISARPFIGVIAVLLGSVISTLANRLTSFGLADVEGAVHAGFDEGAWISTAFTVGQMMVGPASAWLGVVLGPRRVLMFSATIFGLANLLLPLSPNLHFILAVQLISGLSSGTFIPLTIGFVVQSLPARLVVYGVAAYAMNLELSLNVAASIEGWFTTYWSWPWIFWDTALLAPLMLICIHFGMPRQAPNMALLKTTDWAGILFAGLGLSLVYAGLDQGNRLDWLNSGLITGLLLAGAILIIAFVAHELTHDRPWINLRFAASGNIPFLFFYISFFRVISLSTSYIVPQYLATLQNYRELEVGSVLIWVAMPQFLLAPIIATILRFVDARIPLALGFCLVGFACLLGGQLTDQWAVEDFLPGLILQAVGQSFALTSVVWFALKHLQPTEALTFGAILQTGRLFGGELGLAFIQTFIRTREQRYSNLVGLHVVTGAHSVVTRLEQYGAAVFGRSIGEATAQARAIALLAQTLRRQAYVLAFIDAFMIMGVGVIVGLLLMILLRTPPAKPGPGEHAAE
jgi:MFS transporter, DHA2 family, multidrug resistance protein